MMGICEGLGRNHTKAEGRVLKPFGKAIDTRSIIRSVYEDLGAEVTKKLFNQVHEGPMTPALESELHKVATSHGHPEGKELAIFKFKHSDVYFQKTS